MREQNPRTGVIFLIVLLGCAVLYFIGEPRNKGGFTSFLGKEPPEFVNDGTWINSPPLSLAEIRGDVVWLEFGFLH